MIQAPITNEKALSAMESGNPPLTISIEKDKKATKRVFNVVRGEKHSLAKLTDRQVRQIKECFRSKIFMKQFNNNRAAFEHIAQEHNVSWGCIEHIYAGRSWKHI